MLSLECRKEVGIGRLLGLKVEAVAVKRFQSPALGRGLPSGVSL